MLSAACIIRCQGDIFYLLYRIGECGIRRHWRLFETITPLLRSMEGTYHGQVCIVVLVVHLVLGYMYVLWYSECTWYCLCVGYMYSVVLGTQPGTRGEWSLYNSKPFPSPKEF